MLKPHTILLLSALLAGCAAVFLTTAHHEPKAALAAGYALLAGITSLALYLSSRQKASRIPETSDTSAQINAQEVVASENEFVQRPQEIATNLSGETTSRFEPRYTSHSRA